MPEVIPLENQAAVGLPERFDAVEHLLRQRPLLCIGGKIIGPVLAMAIAKTWMETEPLTAERYANRRRKVADIDEERTVAL